MAIQDVISELNRVQSEGLVSDYAVGGAVAAQAYTEPADTEDVDVFVLIPGGDGKSLNPITTVTGNLVAHGAEWNGPYLIIGGWPVQILMGPGTPLYNDAIVDARPHDFGGEVTGRIMGPEYLALIALDTGRQKDYLRVAEFVKRGKVDRAKLLQMIEKYGLAERWKAYHTWFAKNNA